MDFKDTLTSAFTHVLINTLWATGMGMALAVFWGWLPGWSRYGLGLLVVCRLLLPMTPSSPLSAANWWTLPQSGPALGVVETAKAANSAAAVQQWKPAVAAAGEAPPAIRRLGNKEQLACLWLLGVVIYGFQLGWRQKAFNRWWKARKTPAPGVWHESLAVCLQDRPLRRPVRLWQVEGISSPLACGIWHPCILLPAKLETVLGASERVHILRHELAHHRHFDLAWNLVFAATATIHWFNPAVHFGLSWLVREREVQRDADAVRAGAISEAADYGDTLLKLVTSMPRRASTAPGSSAMLGTNHLKQRLIMIPKHIQTTQSTPRIIFAIAAAMLAVLTFTRAQDKISAQEPVPAAATPEGANPINANQGMIFKMNNLVLPKFQFTDAHIDEVLAYLRQKSKDADIQETDPEEKGIDIIQKGDSKTPITCDLRHVTLLTAIKVVCDLAGYRYHFEPHAVMLTRLDLIDEGLQTRFFRINEDVAKDMGWRPGKDIPFSQILAARYGIVFPEGAMASLDLSAGILIARLPLMQLVELEGIIDLNGSKTPVLTLELTAEGIKQYAEQTSKMMTETESAELLKSAFQKNPGTIIKIQCPADIEYSQVSAMLTKVRTAGLKNVDLAIRE